MQLMYPSHALCSFDYTNPSFLKHPFLSFIGFDLDRHRKTHVRRWYKTTIYNVIVCFGLVPFALEQYVAFCLFNMVTMLIDMTCVDHKTLLAPPSFLIYRV